MATQTGSIDLTASNGVKLMAEAGFESIEENYATKAELDVQADRIGMVVANNDASSSLQLTADAMTYIGNNVTIKGTDGTSTVISGGQIQTGSLSIGAFDSAAQSATLNSNVQVGGRNLVWDTAWNDVANRWTAWGSPTTREIVEIDGKRWLHLVTTTTKFQGYQQGSFRRAGYGEIQAGDTLTISFMAYATVAASDISCIGVHWNKSDGSIYGQTWITTDLTTVPKRFVKTVSIADGAPVVGFNIMVGDNSAVARELWISEVKLEKGNKATDWTPAPEDVDSAISNASKTATSYVTEITGQNGIMVHPSTDDDTGVRITSDVDIMRDGYSVINVGTQGDTSGNTDAGVTIYDGTTNENVVATFDGDGIGLVGGAFRLTSERVTEEYGDESNPTTSTEIRSTINTEASNDSYATRCFLRSGLTEGDAAGGGFWELASETDINPEFPTDTKNASVEVGSDPWGSSIRLVADSQELSLSKNPMDNKDYFTLTSEVFLLTDYHNGVNMWSTVPGTVLWSGAYYMTSNHTATLAYSISTCPTGIVLHFQPYTNSTIRNWNHIYYFVPKEHVASYNGSGIVVRLGNPDFSNLASKYLYISNDHITGNDQNNTSGTNSGVSYNNAAWVMTQVIAV